MLDRTNLGGSGTGTDLMANMHHYATVLAAQGRLFVPAAGRIYDFAP